MRTAFIAILFIGASIYVSQTVVSLQLRPAYLNAFVALTVASIALLVDPAFSLFLLIGSVSFYDPRYWFPFLRLWLHQWVILAGLLLLGGRQIFRRQPFPLHPLDRALGAFLLTFLISLVNSPDRSLSLKWIIYSLMMVGAYLLFRLAVSDERRLKRAAVFLVLCGAANGVISFFTPSVGTRVGSLVLANPNALGNYLAMILPLAVSLAVSGGWTTRVRTLLTGSSLFMGVSIVLTLSRSSWVGMTAGLLAISVGKSRFKYLVLIIPLLCSALFFQPVRKRLVEDRADPGVMYRQAKIRMAWEMFRSAPIIGHGPGAFQALAPKTDDWAIAAHSALENLYLQILAEGGIIQAAAFAVFIAFAFLGAVGAYRTAKTPFLRAAVLGSLGGLCAALGIGVGENPFYYPMVNWLVGLHLGIIVKVGELSASATAPALHPPPAPLPPR
jgi:O-antigen ligase